MDQTELRQIALERACLSIHDTPEEVLERAEKYLSFLIANSSEDMVELGVGER